MRYPVPLSGTALLAPEGKTGLIISSLFDYSLTKHIEAMGWYDEFRKLMADRMIQVLDASIYPGLKAAVIDSFTSTPLTHREDFRKLRRRHHRVGIHQ